MFQWLFDRFPRRERLRRRAPHLEALAVHGQFQPSPTLGSDSLVYQQAPWVYLAINRIAEAAALVPLEIRQVLAGREELLGAHPLLELLAAPNPTLSRFELMEQTVGMLELTGNAYWLLLGDAGEVVHFKRWHPGDDLYGLSPLAAARQAIQTDRAMSEWNRGAFGEDKGVPAGIVSIKGPMTEADYERLKREWRASYGGPRRRTAFLRAADIEWQHIGLSHNELDYLRGRQAQRDEILNLFGIPIGLISENATEANAKVAERQFIERTLWPKLVRIAQKITQELLPFYPGQARAEFVDIRPTDVDARLQAIRTAYPILSINEIREQFYQMPPVAWGTRPVGRAVWDGPAAAAIERASAAEKDAALEELRRWERFVKRRGPRPGGRPFAVKQLPAELACEVSARLLLAEDETAQKRVFAEARQLLA